MYSEQKLFHLRPAADVTLGPLVDTSGLFSIGWVLP